MLKHFGKIIIILFAGFLLLSAPNTGSASMSLEFNPLNQSVNLGSLASVDVMVTNPDTLVGAFDFWVNYDSSIISLNSIVWGTGLGTLVPGTDADYSVDDSQTPVSVKLVNLWAQQDDPNALAQGSGSFSLLTLNFDAIAIGMSDLWFTDAYEVEDATYYLSDDELSYVPITNTIEKGSITVARATSVPEPGTALLLGLGLAGLASLKKRNI